MTRAGMLRLGLLAAIIAALFLWRWPPSETPDRPAAYPPGRVIVQQRAGTFRVVDTREGVMGTRFAIEVCVPDEATGRRLCDLGFGLVHEIEQSHSTWIQDSLLSRVNREAADAPVPVDGHTCYVVNQSRRFWKWSDGAFDPTVGPLLRLWKPLATMDAPPTPAEIEKARALVGMDGVSLDDEMRVSFARPGMSLDFGGISKGHAADAVAMLVVAEETATACRINAGGDLAARGAPAWSPEGFEVGIRDPKGGPADALPGTFFVRDRGVATSGNYERYTEIAGQRYSHILDPRTGRPVPDAVVQVTVVAKDAITADAMATALTVLGVDEGLALAERLDDLEAFFVLADEGTPYRFTSGFPGGPR